MNNYLYDIELEQVVIGAALLQSKTLNGDVWQFFKPEVFYDDRHAEIAEAIKKMVDNGEYPDIMTITVHLRKHGKLNDRLTPYYITECSSRVASAANIVRHVVILYQFYLKREMGNRINQFAIDLKDGQVDVFEALEKHEKSMSELMSGIAGEYVKDSVTMWSEMMERNQQIRDHKGLSGVPTGIKLLDHVTGGWQKSDLIILAARPGMGKTALALLFFKFPAIAHKIPTAFFSLEMPSAQLYARLVSQESDIIVKNILRKGLDSFELQTAGEKGYGLRNAPIYVDDTPALTVNQMRIRARKLKKEKGIELIVIDYLQLMQAGVKGMNREAEISYISRSLKALAKELNIPIIALSQLSRSVEARGGDKIPQLSDLRESGAIEQDADVIMFLWRPEYYGIQTDGNGNSTAGKAMCFIRKHRNGGLDDVQVNFEGEFTRFSDHAVENKWS